MDKKEKIFVLLVILLVFVTFFIRMGQSGDKVIIMSDGKEFTNLPLGKDSEVSGKGKNIIKAENRNAWVSYADCPEKLCQNRGK